MLGDPLCLKVFEMKTIRTEGQMNIVTRLTHSPHESLILYIGKDVGVLLLVLIESIFMIPSYILTKSTQAGLAKSYDC